MKNLFAKRIGNKWISLMEIWKPFKNPKKLKIKWNLNFFQKAKKLFVWLMNENFILKPIWSILTRKSLHNENITIKKRLKKIILFDRQKKKKKNG